MASNIWTGRKMMEATVEWGANPKVLSIQNVTSSDIGYQIQTYDDPKLFTFLPPKGVITAKKQAEVEIKLLQKGMEADKLRFHLVAMAWPSGSKNAFDSSVWKTLVAKKEVNNVIHYGAVPEYTGIVCRVPAIEKKDLKLKNPDEAKNLVTVEPSKLSYAAATGEAQTQKATIQNMSSKAVAVKIETNKKLLYTPSNQANASSPRMRVQKSLSKVETKVTQKELDRDNDEHLVILTVLPWISNTKHYDAEEFQKLEKDQKKVQKVMLGVEFGGKGSKTNTKKNNEGCCCWLALTLSL